MEHFASLSDYLYGHLSGMPYILALVVGLGILIQLVGLFGLLLFKFRPIPQLRADKPLPGATIIKPCFSNRDNEEENFDAFFNQDYPGKIQILFVVSQDTDP